MPGDTNHVSLVNKRAESSSKHIEAEGSSPSHIDFYQIKRGPENIPSDGLYGCFEVPTKGTS